MPLASRAVLSLVSQAINTGQNLLLALLAARYSPVEEYGAWGIAFAVFVAAQAVSRSVISTPQLIKTEARDSVPVSASAGASLIVAGPISLAILLAGFLLSGPVEAALLVMALVMPCAILQDALRYSLIRAEQFRRLVATDAVWVVGQVSMSAVLIIQGAADAQSLTIAWGLGAALSSLYVLVVARLWPSLQQGRRFLRRERRAGTMMALESSIGTMAANSVPIVVGILLGLEASGHFRGAMTIAGGIGFFVTGLTPIMTLESSRRMRAGTSAKSLVGLWSGGLAILSLLYWGFFALLPSSAGSALLGETWGGTYGLLLMFAMQSVMRGPVTGVPIILRARHQFDEAIRLRLSTSWVQVAAPAVGAALGGVTGAGWGYAGAAAANGLQSLHRMRGSTVTAARESSE